MMKYYLIAGEASGDLHGSNLIRHILKSDPEASVRCWGGDRMAAAGATLIKHFRDLAFMGFVEVIKNLPAILRNIKFCKNDISAFDPDVIVFIDYPGFNMRIAKWAKKNSFKTVWYIAPQVWAWKESRVKALRRDIDKLLVILPFENAYFAKHGINAEYTGHPLVPLIDRERSNPGLQKKVIAILAGSRRQEVAVKLPLMLAATAEFTDHQITVAAVPWLDTAFYNDILAPFPNAALLLNDTYGLLRNAEAALVTSGTATLETALFRVPQVVCYKGNPVSFALAKRLVKIKFISLVNLITGRELVKELIQNELTVPNILKELNRLLFDVDHRSRILKGYDELHETLVCGEDPSEKAANAVIRLAAANAKLA